MGEARREFLGWDAPTLPAAARLLLNQAADLSGWLVVLPGRRSARVLLGMLVDEAARRGVVLAPPTTLTPGELAAAIFRPHGVPASPLLRRLTWSSVLRESTPDELAPLVRLRPHADDQARWAALAAIVEQVSDDLAQDLIIPGEVPAQARAISGFNEAERWRAFALLQDRYAQRLSRAGVVDDALAALHACRQPGAIAARSVALVGVPELRRVAAASLRALPDGGGCVTAMIAAPPDLASRFDALGCVRPEAWGDVTIPLDDNALAFAQAPRDQARRAIEFIASLPEPFAPHEITLGVPDAEVLPAIEREAQRTGLPVRRAAGVPLRQSAPAALLGDIATHLESRTFESLVRLIQRPEVEAYLRAALAPARGGGGGAGKAPRTEWWLAEIQDYAASSLATSVDAPILTARAQASLITGVIRGVDAMLAELLDAPRVRQPSRWGAALRAVFARVYAGQRLDRTSLRDVPTIDAVARLRDTLAHLDALPEEGLAELSAPDTLRLIIDVSGDAPLPAQPRPNAAEVLGWLELPLDPAPVLVVTGVNEGLVPGGNVADPFLPDALRRALGMSCDQSRLARDTFLLRAIVTSRPHVLLVCGRQAADVSPLRPSRLLAACEPTAAAARVLRFADPRAEPAPSLRVRSRLAPGGKGGFEPRPVRAAAPITSMRVTAFRDYLASPYAFYLRHVLRLEEAGPPDTEMDALAFGVLVHNALKRFGRDPMARDLTSANPIAAFLHEALDAEAHDTFGQNLSPVLQLQLAAARRRLSAFARHQATRRAEGWRIAHTEWPEDRADASLMVDAQPFGLRGRIDRIDIHDSTGAWAILDYKTGDTVKPPQSTHQRGERWVDLQLPLYRHLVTTLNPPQDPTRITLGYASISSDLDASSFLIAAWTPDDLAAADAAAADVVRGVRAQRFDILGDAPPDEGILAYLCGVGFPSPTMERAP